MKKYISIFVAVVILFLVVLPQNIAEAAISVKTKSHTYQGQGYVQIIGGNKTATNKINKILKAHAVNAAKWDKENKQIDKSSWYKSLANTKYNKNERLSVVYTDAIYTGGAHEIYGTTAYNFDLKTGNLIKLNDVVNTESKIYNLIEAISTNLQSKYDKGENIFSVSISYFPIGPDSAFFYYDKGIVIRFDPYDVAPFSEGFIDIKIPYTTLNKTNNKATPVLPPVTNTTPKSSTSDLIESQIDDDFEGYDEGNIYELSNGQIWKQVSYTYSYHYAYRPEVIIYKDGSRYYMKVEDMDDAVQVERIK